MNLDKQIHLRYSVEKAALKLLSITVECLKYYYILELMVSNLVQDVVYLR